MTDSPQSYRLDQAADPLPAVPPLPPLPMSSRSWVDGPLLALDLETTGLDPHRDRVVSAALVLVRPGIDTVVHEWLVDPGVDIPAEATAVHGISTAHARAHGRPPEAVLGELRALLAQQWAASTPLCAINAAYDLTLLDAELRRHQGNDHLGNSPASPAGLVLSGPVIDALCIDRHLRAKAPGGRTLAALCAHYKVRLDKAHDSREDALAGARLAWRLGKWEPHRIGGVAPHRLHELQASWFRDQQYQYADRQDREIRQRKMQAPVDLAKITRLQARADNARYSAKSWPLLPDSPAAAAAHAAAGTVGTVGAVGGGARVRPPRPGGPAQSHASWTADLDTALRTDWLAADPAAPADAVHEDLAASYGRSSSAIRSRLMKLLCDAERPGQACDQQRADELRAQLDAQYGRR